MHTNQRPLNSKIDSVNVPGVAQDVTLEALLEIIEIQKQQSALLRAIFLQLSSFSGGQNTSMDIDFLNQTLT